MVHVISPEESTLTAIGETAARIDLFLAANHSLPPDLVALPKREGFMNQITDGWGRELIYSRSEDETISLTSLGRDGTRGGMGDDADITHQFRTRNDDGSFGLNELYMSDAKR
jgi:hypothetical protein